MELILISKDKLKIMLSQNDMEKYNIAGEDLDYERPQTRHIIKDILKEAESLTGFNIDGQAFCVKLFTSARGGCELFITKGEEEASEPKICYEVQKPMLSLYSFDSFYDLISVCRQLLCTDGFCGDTAFRDVSGKYYLRLTRGGVQYSKLDELTFIGEYGKKESLSQFDTYIKEYGTWVCRDAVNILGNL